MINPDSPVKVQWLRSDGNIKDLKWYEKIFAYGVDYELTEEAGYLIKIVSFRYLDVHFYIDKFKNPHFETVLKGKKVSLICAFVELGEDSGIWPDVKYVDVFGIDVADGQQIRERFYP